MTRLGDVNTQNWFNWAFGHDRDDFEYTHNAPMTPLVIVSS